MLLKGVLSDCLLNRRRDMGSATYCTCSLALTKREAGRAAVLQRNLSANHFLCHWIAWGPRGRYSSFENKAKKGKDTGGKKLVCGSTEGDVSGASKLRVRCVPPLSTLGTRGS